MINFKHIVIIDDDEVTNFLNEDFLESFGCSVNVNTFSTAEDGMIFLQQLCNLPEESVLLLLDLRMPGMDGFDLMDSLIENYNITSLYVIILTCFVDPESKLRIKEYPISGIIEKPLNGIALSEILKEPKLFYKPVLDLSIDNNQ